MATALLPDQLWDLVEPFLPMPISSRRHTVGGRVSRIARASQALSSSFVAVFPGRRSRWNSGGSGMTCWRRLRDWQRAGVWDLIHFALLDWLARGDEIDSVAGGRGPLFHPRRLRR